MESLSFFRKFVRCSIAKAILSINKNIFIFLFIFSLFFFSFPFYIFIINYGNSGYDIVYFANAKKNLQASTTHHTTHIGTTTHHTTQHVPTTHHTTHMGTTTHHTVTNTTPVNTTTAVPKNKTHTKTIKKTKTHTKKVSFTDTLTLSLTVPRTPTVTFSQTITLPITPTATISLTDTLSVTKSLPITPTISLQFCTIIDKTEEFIKKRLFPRGHPYYDDYYPLSLKADADKVKRGTAFQPYIEDWREKRESAINDVDVLLQSINTGDGTNDNVEKKYDGTDTLIASDFTTSPIVVNKKEKLEYEGFFLNLGSDDVYKNNENNNNIDNKNNYKKKDYFIVGEREKNVLSDSMRHNEFLPQQNTTKLITTKINVTTTPNKTLPNRTKSQSISGNRTHPNATTHITLPTTTPKPTRPKPSNVLIILSPLPIITTISKPGDVFSLEIEYIPTYKSSITGENLNGYERIIRKTKIQNEIDNINGIIDRRDSEESLYAYGDTFKGTVINSTHFAVSLGPVPDYSIQYDERLALYLRSSSIGYCKHNYLKNNIQERFLIAYVEITAKPSDFMNIGKLIASVSLFFTFFGVTDFQCVAAVLLMTCGTPSLRALSSWRVLSPFALDDTPKGAWIGCIILTAVAFGLIFFISIFIKFFMLGKKLSSKYKHKVMSSSKSRQKLKSLSATAAAAAAAAQHDKNTGLLPQDLPVANKPRYAVSKTHHNVVNIPVMNRRALILERLKFDEYEDDQEMAMSSIDEGDDLLQLITPSQNKMNNVVESETVAEGGEESPDVEKNEENAEGGESEKEVAISSNTSVKSSKRSEESDEEKKTTVSKGSNEKKDAMSIFLAKKKKIRELENRRHSFYLQATSVAAGRGFMPYDRYQHDTVDLALWRTWTAAFAYAHFPSISISIGMTMFFGILYSSFQMLIGNDFLSSSESKLQIGLGVIGLIWGIIFFCFCYFFPKKFLSRSYMEIFYEWSMVDCDEKNEEIDEALEEEFYTNYGDNVGLKSVADSYKDYNIIHGFRNLNNNNINNSISAKSHSATDLAMLHAPPLTPTGRPVSLPNIVNNGVINPVVSLRSRLEILRTSELSPVPLEDPKAVPFLHPRSNNVTAFEDGEQADENESNNNGDEFYEEEEESCHIVPRFMWPYLYPVGMIMPVVERKMFSSLIEYIYPSAFWPTYPLWEAIVFSLFNVFSKRSKVNPCKASYAFLAFFEFVLLLIIWIQRPKTIPIVNFLYGLRHLCIALVIIFMTNTFSEDEITVNDNLILLIIILMVIFALLRLLLPLYSFFAYGNVSETAVLIEEWHYTAPHENLRGTIKNSKTAAASGVHWAQKRVSGFFSRIADKVPFISNRFKSRLWYSLNKGGSGGSNWPEPSAAVTSRTVHVSAPSAIHERLPQLHESMPPIQISLQRPFNEESDVCRIIAKEERRLSIAQSPMNTYSTSIPRANTNYNSDNRGYYSTSSARFNNNNTSRDYFPLSTQYQHSQPMINRNNSYNNSNNSKNSMIIPINFDDFDTPTEKNDTGRKDTFEN